MPRENHMLLHAHLASQNMAHCTWWGTWKWSFPVEVTNRVCRKQNLRMSFVAPSNCSRWTSLISTDSALWKGISVCLTIRTFMYHIISCLRFFRYTDHKRFKKTLSLMAIFSWPLVNLSGAWKFNELVFIHLRDEVVIEHRCVFDNHTFRC